MVKEWVYRGRNPDTEGEYFSLEEVGNLGAFEPPSIDDFPPPGLEDVPLSKERPKGGPTTGGKGKEVWFPTFIELSQTAHDRDKED